ncbi:hypothetical protein LJC06_01765 [Bacteroidales bacterium OttesenSCG-928-I14]|nr:hypothetical protein [Bacteroidales bacterium OttesenSCG-928-I14]
METKFTEKESLAVIQEMINRAQNNMNEGSGSSMIYWGYTTAIIAILNVILIFILETPYQSFWVWCLTIPAFIVSYFIERKKDRTAMIKSHIDDIISTTWNGFVFSNILLLILIFSLSDYFQTYYLFTLINPLILILIGIAELVTAKACRFKPYLYGAITVWIGALLDIAIIIVFKGNVTFQFVVLAICMITAFVIPGYKLNKKAKEDVQRS